MKGHHGHAHDDAHSQAEGIRPLDQPHQHAHHAGQAAPSQLSQGVGRHGSHHAHMVACMAENEVSEQVIGVGTQACDNVEIVVNVVGGIRVAYFMRVAGCMIRDEFFYFLF